MLKFPYEVQSLSCNDSTIEYVELNKGADETLVFVHGLGSNLRQWQPQLEAFKNQYHIIAFSLQGHGDSDRLDPVGYSIEMFAKTAIALLHQLGVTSCHWIGNSMGGVIGYEVLNIKPKLFKSLIINGTTPKLVMSTSTLKFVVMIDKFLIRLLGFNRYVGIAANASIKDKDIRQKLLSIFQAASPEVIKAMRSELGNYDYMELLKSTDLPIHIITTPGDKDINRSMKNLWPTLNQLAHVHHIGLESGGHIVNMDSPVLYNEAISRILEL